MNWMGALSVLILLMARAGGHSEKDILSHDSNDCSLFQTIKSLRRQGVSNSWNKITHQIRNSWSSLVFHFLSSNNNFSRPARVEIFHIGVRAVIVALFLVAAPLAQSYSITAENHHTQVSSSDPSYALMDSDSSSTYSNDKTEPPVIGSSPIRMYISFLQRPSDHNEIESKQQKDDLCQSANGSIRTDTEYEAHVLEIPRRFTLPPYEFMQGTIKPRVSEHAYEPFVSSKTVWLQRNQEEFNMHQNPVRHTVNVPKRQCVNTMGIPIAHSICHQRYYVKIWKIDFDVSDDNSRTVISRRLLRYDSFVKKYSDFSPVYMQFKLPVEKRNLDSSGSEEVCAKKENDKSQVLVLTYPNKENATVMDNASEVAMHERQAYENDKEVRFISAKDENFPVETVFTTQEGEESTLDHESQTLKDKRTQSDTMEWIILCILFATTVAFLTSVRCVSNGYINFDHRVFCYFFLDSSEAIDHDRTKKGEIKKYIGKGDGLVGAGDENDINSLIVSSGVHEGVESVLNSIVIVCDQDLAMDDLSISPPGDSKILNNGSVSSNFGRQGGCNDSQQSEQFIGLTTMNASVDDFEATKETVTTVQGQDFIQDGCEIESPPSIDRKGSWSDFHPLQIQDSSSPHYCEAAVSLDKYFALSTIETLPQYSGVRPTAVLETTEVLKASDPKQHDRTSLRVNDPTDDVQILFKVQPGSNSNLLSLKFTTPVSLTDDILSLPNTEIDHKALSCTTQHMQGENSLYSTHVLRIDDFTSRSRSSHHQNIKSPARNCNNSDHINIGMSPQMPEPLEKTLSTIHVQAKCFPIRLAQSASSCVDRSSQSFMKKGVDASSQTFGTHLDGSPLPLKEQNTTDIPGLGTIFFESSNNFDSCEKSAADISCAAPSNNILTSAKKQPDPQTKRVQVGMADASYSDSSVVSPQSNNEDDILYKSQSRKRKYDALKGTSASVPTSFKASSKMMCLVPKREGNPSYEEDCDSKAEDIVASIQNDENKDVAVYENCEQAKTTGEYRGVPLGTKATSTPLKKHSEFLSLEAPFLNTANITNTQVNDATDLSRRSDCGDDTLSSSFVRTRETGSQNDNTVLPSHYRGLPVDSNSGSTTSFLDTEKCSTDSLVFGFEVISTDAIRQSPISRSSRQNLRELHQNSPESDGLQVHSVQITHASTTTKRPVFPQVADLAPSKGLMSLSQEFQDPVWEFSESALSTSKVIGTKRKLRDISNLLGNTHFKRNKAKSQLTMSKRSMVTSGSDISKLRGHRKHTKTSNTANIPCEIIVMPTKEARSEITAPRFHCKQRCDKSSKQDSAIRSSQSSGNEMSKSSSSKSSRVY
eukprot:scaffold1552_cov241-Chaetoceros_neogracile.AAC.5